MAGHSRTKTVEEARYVSKDGILEELLEQKGKRLG